MHETELQMGAGHESTAQSPTAVYVKFNTYVSRRIRAHQSRICGCIAVEPGHRPHSPEDGEGRLRWEGQVCGVWGRPPGPLCGGLPQHYPLLPCPAGLPPSTALFILFFLSVSALSSMPCMEWDSSGNCIGSECPHPPVSNSLGEHPPTATSLSVGHLCALHLTTSPCTPGCACQQQQDAGCALGSSIYWLTAKPEASFLVLLVLCESFYTSYLAYSPIESS